MARRLLVTSLSLLALAACRPGAEPPAATVAPVTPPPAAPAPAQAAPHNHAGTWVPGPYTAIARGNHAAELLPEGRVLLAGGRTNLHDHQATSMGMEVVDLRPDRDITVYRNAPRRIGHSLTRLGDGRVLLLGGTEADAPMDAQSTWLYNPAADNWSFPAGPDGVAPVYHTATALPDGTVLLAGGRRNGFPVSSTEAGVIVFDPAAASTRKLPPLLEARAEHTATLLADGRVLIAGGWGEHGQVTGAEIYDPTSGRRTALSGAAPRSEHTATLLQDGRVLFVGGDEASTFQLFDPATSSFLPAQTAAEAGRRDHTATLLPCGAVLIAGGYVSGKGATADVAIYEPASAAWRRVAPLASARTGHTATRLEDGRVLVVGGNDLTDASAPRARMDPYLRSTEIFSDNE